MFILFLISSTALGWALAFLPHKLARYLAVTTLSVIGVFILLFNDEYHLSEIPLVQTLVLAFQIFNIYRVGMLRYQTNTAKRVLNTGLMLSVTAAVFSLFDYLFQAYSLLNIYSVSLIVFILGLIGLRMVGKNIHKVHMKYSLPENELPTVSVLIPARNEDAQLEDCIESVLASDYPKLEILVLDDCSQDKSSEIIKSFAQKGVRFIQGDVPKDNWLAKNQAYKTLAESASGQWYLFMGVDIRLNKKTIRSLVTELTSSDISMASIMPEFTDSKFREIFYSLRYYWEVALPRFVMRNPATVSSCWAIKKEALMSCGGFDAVFQSVLPERYFAKQTDIDGKYRFYRSTTELYVSTNKTYRDQKETSERLLYPQLRKSVFRLFVMSLLVLLSAAQYALLMNAVIQRNTIETVFALLGLAPSVASQFIVASYQAIPYKLTRALLMPVILIQELVLASVSAYRYEFSEVIWKGRNVCYPALKVIPRLPKI